MKQLKIIDTLSGLAIEVDNRIIVLSELAELQEPGYTRSISTTPYYGIYYKLKGNNYSNIIYEKDFFNKAGSQTEVDAYLIELKVIYNTIKEYWIQ